MVSCSKAPKGGAYQVSWVGIDGNGTSTVEQDGTLSYCSTTGSDPPDYDWWELPGTTTSKCPPPSARGTLCRRTFFTIPPPA